MVRFMSTAQNEPNIEWGDPPPKMSGRTATGKWQKVVGRLKERPGQWAKVATDVYASTGQHLKEKGCEVTTRKTEGLHPDSAQPLVDVWARWPEGADDE